MNYNKIKEVCEKKKIPINLYPDAELFSPVFEAVIDECCNIATQSGKPMIAKRIKEYFENE